MVCCSLLLLNAHPSSGRGGQGDESVTEDASSLNGEIAQIRQGDYPYRPDVKHNLCIISIIEA